MNSEKLLNLYGCKRHPFGRELRRALEPQNEEELAWYAKVDGFAERVQFIEDWFARLENLEERAIIMVYGPKGCGSSSVVHYIVHHFCRAMRLDMQEQLSLLSITNKNNDEMGPVLDVLAKLYMQLNDLGENLVEVHKTLNDFYMNHVFTGADPSKEQMYKLIFRRTKPILDGYNRTPIIVLDQIRSYEQIKRCTEVFKDAPLILVTTHERGVLRRFITSQLHGFEVELRKLTLEDVEAFLVQRWQVFSEGEHHPFAEKGLQEVFEYFKEDKTWSFRSVVNILAKVFNEHLEDLAKNMPTSTPPPTISESYMFKKAMLYMRDVGMVLDGRQRNGDEV